MTVAWRADGAAVIVLSGELDIGSAPRLQRRVTETARRATGDVHLDAASLRFCDAAGLSAIAAAAEELRRSGRRLHIDHPPAHFLRVLDITHLRHLVG